MNGGVVVTEMTIVDTFTKLIFAVDDDYSAIEHAVIDAFRAVEANVYRDSTQEMGEYLRAIWGCREMIQLVCTGGTSILLRTPRRPRRISSGEWVGRWWRLPVTWLPIAGRH